MDAALKISVLVKGHWPRAKLVLMLGSWHDGRGELLSGPAAASCVFRAAAKHRLATETCPPVQDGPTLERQDPWRRSAHCRCRCSHRCAGVGAGPTARSSIYETNTRQNKSQEHGLPLAFTRTRLAAPLQPVADRKIAQRKAAVVAVSARAGPRTKEAGILLVVHR